MIEMIPILFIYYSTFDQMDINGVVPPKPQTLMRNISVMKLRSDFELFFYLFVLSSSVVYVKTEKCPLVAPIFVV